MPPAVTVVFVVFNAVVLAVAARAEVALLTRPEAVASAAAAEEAAPVMISPVVFTAEAFVEVAETSCGARNCGGVQCSSPMLNGDEMSPKMTANLLTSAANSM